MAMILTTLPTGGRPSDQTAGDTTAIAPLGSMFQENPDPDSAQAAMATQGAGGRLWRYIKNGDATTAFAEGTVVTNKDGNSPSIGERSASSANPNRVIGVAQYAIAVGSYGWILVEGVGEVKPKAATTLTANTGLTPAAGTVGTAEDVAAATNACFAVTLEASPSAAGLTTCWISCKH